MEKDKRDIELFFEIGSMKNIQRGWRQHLAMDCGNNLDHTMRVVFVALKIARAEGVTNEDKIIKMALMHDLPEARTSDLSYVQKVYCKPDEEKAAKDMTDGTSFEDFNVLFLEYEKRECIEAKIVKDADNLDIDIELKEIEERGSKLNDKWRWSRELIRNEKFYTETAKKIWDDLQTSDPSDWHMNTNKWKLDPTAGK